MAKMNFDEEGLLDEPCLSCEKSYIEDIWFEWCCDEKECIYRIKTRKKNDTSIPVEDFCIDSIGQAKYL
jgi:hypothetical protein